MRSRRILLACLALFVASSLVGCSSLQAALTPDPEVITEEATVAAAGATVSGELSPETPEGLPLWPGAEVIESVAAEDSYSLTLSTGDSYDDVLPGMAAGFERAGWEVTSEESNEGGRIAVLSLTAEGQEGFITITELESGAVQLDYVLVTTE